MNERFIRDVYYYKNYYVNFFESLNPDVKRKFNWVIKLIATLERIPTKFFKHIENSAGIYEIRVEYGGNIYRVFSFFDQGQLIILINGFQRKSRKTPRNELKKAERIRKEYFDEKESR